MRIGFIGAGKVGFTFGRYIAEKRELVREKTDGALCLEVGGYFSASRQSAELAAEFTETCVYDSLEQLCEYSEIIFLTVPDGQPQAGLTDLEQIRQAEGVVTIKAAPQALDGLLVSFANEKDAGRILSIAYAGKTYDNQGDNTKSTIHGATAKQKIALAFYEATNEMNGYYCGPFVDVQ